MDDVREHKKGHRAAPTGSALITRPPDQRRYRRAGTRATRRGAA
jgi:hypothetical protein